MRSRIIPGDLPPVHDRPRHRNLRARHTANSKRGRCPDARPLGSPLPPDRPGPVPVKPGVGNPRALAVQPPVSATARLACAATAAPSRNITAARGGNTGSSRSHSPAPGTACSSWMTARTSTHPPGRATGSSSAVPPTAPCTRRSAAGRRTPPAGARTARPAAPVWTWQAPGTAGRLRPARRLLTLSSDCSPSSTTRTRPRPLPAPSRTSKSSPRCYATPGPSAGTSWTPAWPQQPTGTSAG